MTLLYSKDEEQLNRIVNPMEIPSAKRKCKTRRENWIRQEINRHQE
jgi:hypothetical protein